MKRSFQKIYQKDYFQVLKKLEILHFLELLLVH